MSLEYPIYNSNYKNILLIDRTVPDYQVFVDSVNDSTFYITYSYDSTKDQLLNLLQTNFSSIDRIGFVFSSNHGIPITFLDNVPFFSNDETIIYSENVNFLISIIKEFNIGTVDFLACNTLQYPNWVDYYNILTKETGVIIGASNDRTGNIKYGGDWIMESDGVNIEFIYFTKSIENYSDLLDSTSSHTVVLKNDGTVWGTGWNNQGQLGLGDTDSRKILTQMTSIPPVYQFSTKSISGGNRFTIILMNDGSLWGTGINTSGQLGLGNTDNKLTLNQITTTSPSGYQNRAKYISCGGNHTIVLMNDGTLWGTGENGFGQLGLGNTNNKSTLTQITTTFPLGYQTRSKYISCGAYYTIILMDDGTVWGTGSNYSGQLGLGNTDNKSILTQITTTTFPLGYQFSAKYISCGLDFTIILMNDGTIWGTGKNTSGQLGLGNNNDKLILTQITTTIPSGYQFNAKYVSCGWKHTIVLMNDGTLWGTGYNGTNDFWSGQLGLSDTNDRVNLTQITTTFPSGYQNRAKYISCGAYHTIVLMDDGTVWGTGSNVSGQLGLNTTTPNYTILQPMVDANGNRITGVVQLMDTIEQLMISNICFPASTPIQTDQGIVAICKIDPSIHTIDRKIIVDITRTVSTDKYLICFKKNAFGLDYPCNDTIMTKDHKVYFKGELIPAEKLLINNRNTDRVFKIKYNGEVLYNVLMEDYTMMAVNNLVCETLHPNNIISKFYTRQCKYTYEMRNKILVLLEKCVKKKDYTTYHKILEKY
jgi:alpha-tubulin suppressor-like RCC1 family protein